MKFVLILQINPGKKKNNFFTVCPENERRSVERKYSSFSAISYLNKRCNGNYN